MLDFQKLNDCFNCRVYSVDLQKHCMHIVVGDVLARDCRLPLTWACPGERIFDVLSRAFTVCIWYLQLLFGAFLDCFLW